MVTVAMVIVAAITVTIVAVTIAMTTIQIPQCKGLRMFHVRSRFRIKY